MSAVVVGFDLPAMLVVADRLGYRDPELVELIRALEEGMIKGIRARQKEAEAQREIGSDDEDGSWPVSSAGDDTFEIGA
jgi:hypothetical protein